MDSTFRFTNSIICVLNKTICQRLLVFHLYQKCRCGYGKPGGGHFLVVDVYICIK